LPAAGPSLISSLRLLDSLVALSTVCSACPHFSTVISSHQSQNVLSNTNEPGPGDSHLLASLLERLRSGGLRFEVRTGNSSQDPHLQTNQSKMDWRCGLWVVCLLCKREALSQTLVPPKTKTKPQMDHCKELLETSLHLASNLSRECFLVGSTCPVIGSSLTCLSSQT
jgi:hypothetical protein